MVRRLISCCMALLMLGCALAEDELDITYRFGNREEKKIAVTIDDCYHAEDVRAVLDILQANDVRATFFPIGKALKYEDAALWQEVVASGCEIGNHSWGHTYLTKLSRQKIKFLDERKTTTAATGQTVETDYLLGTASSFITKYMLGNRKATRFRNSLAHTALSRLAR